MKIKIGKYSSENGVSAAARRFSAELGRDINPSTIHGFKRAYLQELNRKRRAEEDDLTITSLPVKKRGPRAPPTTSWRGLRTRLAKLNLAKILPQYKGRAIGENFIPRIFCRIRYLFLFLDSSFNGSAQDCHTTSRLLIGNEPGNKARIDSLCETLAKLLATSGHV